MSSSFTPPEAGLEIAPPSTLEILWINHRGALLGGVAAVLVLFLIVLGVIVANRASTIASETMFSQAKDAAAWSDLIAKYPHSAAAADAILLLAASLRDNGKLDESDALYSRFAESFPQSPIAVSGMIGRASNARIAGQSEQVLNDYQQAAVAYPQSYGAPFALFSAARLLAREGRTEDVKRILQSLTTTYPGSLSAQATGVSPTQTGN